MTCVFSTQSFESHQGATNYQETPHSVMTHHGMSCQADSQAESWECFFLYYSVGSFDIDTNGVNFVYVNGSCVPSTPSWQFASIAEYFQGDFERPIYVKGKIRCSLAV